MANTLIKIQESSLDQVRRIRLTLLGMLLLSGISLVGVSLYSLLPAANVLIDSGNVWGGAIRAIVVWFYGSMLAQPCAIIGGGVLGWTSSRRTMRSKRWSVYVLSVAIAIMIAALAYVLGKASLSCLDKLYECMVNPPSMIEHSVAVNAAYFPELIWASSISAICGGWVAKRLLTWK